MCRPGFMGEEGGKASLLPSSVAPSYTGCAFTSSARRLPNRLRSCQPLHSTYKDDLYLYIFKMTRGFLLFQFLSYVTIRIIDPGVRLFVPVSPFRWETPPRRRFCHSLCLGEGCGETAVCLEKSLRKLDKPTQNPVVKTN